VSMVFGWELLEVLDSSLISSQEEREREREREKTWGTPVEFGCLLTYRQLISGCRVVRNLSPTGALFLFHDVRLYDPERRSVRGPPRKCLGMSALIQRGDSWPPLPRVELIQKVSTKRTNSNNA
jgi:hypothetical protein